MKDKKQFNLESDDNLGNHLLLLESLCNDDDKPYKRAYWEYKTGDKKAVIMKYPQWAKQFAIDYAGEVK